MTKLEQQNDSLNAQLDELLESSRQARKELQEVKESENVDSDAPMDTSSSDSNNQKENDWSPVQAFEYTAWLFNPV